MSDATFRIDDWGRTGADGKPRALHIREAMESIDFERGPVDPITPRVEPLAGGGRRALLSQSAYFALERLDLTQVTAVGRRDRFTILMALNGRCVIRHGQDSVPLEFGQTLLLPAALGPCEILPRGGVALLSCVVP
jgi:mannose-6-phosphate isomerase